MMLEQLDNHVPEDELRLRISLTLYVKINSKWIIDFNVRVKL